MVPLFRAQIEEIASDPALRFFGGACAGVNAVTALFWLISQPIGAILAPATVPTACWPFFETCHQWRVLEKVTMELGVVSLMLLSVYNARSFLNRQRISSAYFLLLALTAVKVLLILQDYRLLLNQHYMAVWITGVYLFVPAKRTVLPWLLVSFYFWAGTLKLNADWLSGAALLGTNPLGIPDGLIPYACAYVIVLELLVAPLLLARSRWVHRPALGQFVVFHVASWWVVGFFYPVLMFLLLSIFPLTWAFPFHEGAKSWWSNLVDRRARWTTVAIVGLFGVMQFLPRALGPDPALTGEGRMFALNMFDAPIDCEATITIRAPGGERHERPLVPMYLQRRLACDPLVYFEASRFLCDAGRHLWAGDDFDLSLRSGRRGQAARELVAIVSFCSSGHDYAVLRHNPWIRLE